MLTSFYDCDSSQELFHKINASLQISYYEKQTGRYKFVGLYSIYKDDVCYYVGQSQNLASRVAQHLKGKYQSADRIDLYIADVDEIEKLEKTERKRKLEANESFLIKHLKPIENLLLPIDDFELLPSHAFSTMIDEDGPESSCSMIKRKHEIYFIPHNDFHYCNSELALFFAGQAINDIEIHGIELVKKGYLR